MCLVGFNLNVWSCSFFVLCAANRFDSVLDGTYRALTVALIDWIRTIEIYSCSVISLRLDGLQRPVTGQIHDLVCCSMDPSPAPTAPVQEEDDWGTLSFLSIPQPFRFNNCWFSIKLTGFVEWYFLSPSVYYIYDGTNYWITSNRVLIWLHWFLRKFPIKFYVNLVASYCQFMAPF